MKHCSKIETVISDKIWECTIDHKRRGIVLKIAEDLYRCDLVDGMGATITSGWGRSVDSATSNAFEAARKLL